MKSYTKIIPSWKPSPRLTALVFRVTAHIALAAIALTVPEVGDNRYLLAGLLIGFSPPVAVFLNFKVSESARNWVEALFDLTLVVVLVHLVPHLWVVALCLGLMVALAPSVSLHPSSHWIYMGFGFALLTGMSFAAVIHEISDWELPIAAVSVSYPAMLYYTYTQMNQARELRQRAQLLRGMSDVAGGVAHDFNNILMGISGHAQLGLATLAADHPVHRHLIEVLGGTERASALSGQLQRFAGRRLSNANTLDLEEEVRLVVRLLRSVVSANIEVRGPNESLCVEMSAPELHHLLINALLDADIIAGSSQSELEVVISIASESEHRSTACAQVSISTPQIANLQDREYTPYFDAKYLAGTGLNDAKKVMARCNGSISTHTRGRKYELVIRWYEFETNASVQELPLQAHSNLTERDKLPSPVKVLVIDDEEMVLEVTRTMISALCEEVIAVQDAQAAMEIFKKDYPSIAGVVLDLKMPKMDGWTCLQIIREVAANMPVIICSGFNPNEDMPDFAKQDEYIRFLNKPFRAAQLEQLLFDLRVLEGS